MELASIHKVHSERFYVVHVVHLHYTWQCKFEVKAFVSVYEY
jgi:hypothetical protein